MRRRLLFRPKKTTSPFKHILLVILDGPLLENEIYRRLVQTGLPGLAYKQKIMAAIEYLEKGGFIVDVSGLKRHKSGKWQPKELTSVGRELVELIHSIDQYYKSYSKLTNIIEQNFRVPYIEETIIQHFEGVEMDQQHNTALRNILRNKGWSDESIDRCGEIFIKTLLVRQTFSPESILSTVIMKYIYLISKSDPVAVIDDDNKPNEAVKKEILNEIIGNAISDHLSYVYKETDKFKSLCTQWPSSSIVFNSGVVFRRVIRGAENDMMSTIFHSNLMNDNLVRNNPIIKKEIMNTFESITSISQVGVGESVDGRIEDSPSLIHLYRILFNQATVMNKRQG